MNEVALRKEDTQLFVDLFRDFSISDLTAAVEAVSADDLDDNSKGHALSIIQEWNTNVIGRIRQRETEMDEMLNYFEHERSYVSSRYSAYEEDLAEKSGTLEEYEAYIAKKSQMKVLDNEYPSDYKEDPAYEKMSDEDRILTRQKYELEVFKHNQKKNKLQKEIQKDYVTWKSKMRALPAVSEMISKAKEYKRNVSRYKQDCTDLSLMAKSNILVANKDVRDVFRKMVNFSKGI